MIETAPPGAFDSSVDALSDVLDLVHMRGEELRTTQSESTATFRHSGERMVHLVRQGPVELAVADERLRLDRGDTALMATGAPHHLTAGPGAAWMSGRFAADETAAGPLLEVLPPVIVIRAAAGEVRWIPLAGELLNVELTQTTSGSRVMVSRLLDLVFIQILRAWAHDGDGAIEGGPGWLTAALDPTLGPALRAIHRHPERTWVVEDLARMTNLSRAAFAARFTQKVGDPPARYLTRIRLALAADQLNTTTRGVAEIGRGVGYESEAAFSRAFSREYAASPTTWRTTHSG